MNNREVIIQWYLGSFYAWFWEIGPFLSLLLKNRTMVTASFRSNSLNCLK